MQRPEASEAEHNQSVACVYRLWLSHACSTISTDLPRTEITEQTQACFQLLQNNSVIRCLTLSPSLFPRAINPRQINLTVSQNVFGNIFGIYSRYLQGYIRQYFSEPIIAGTKMPQGMYPPPLSGIYNPGGYACNLAAPPFLAMSSLTQESFQPCLPQRCN